MKQPLDLKAFLENKLGQITPTEEAKTAITNAEQTIPKNLMLDAESSEFKPETTPVVLDTSSSPSVEQAKLFDDEMNRFIDTVLIAGVDYGLIPNCKKPSLLKSGAEKVMNYLGLIARVEVVNRVEDYSVGFFAYECKVFLLDYNGAVRGEGLGITNTKESKYAKSSGYSMQNVVLKMAKKRALVDAVLNVGNLSARFTQDVEDMNLEADNVVGKHIEAYSQIGTPKNDRPATQKQLQYLENFMAQYHTSIEAMNRYVKEHFAVEDYRKITSTQASLLIDKFKSVEQQ